MEPRNLMVIGFILMVLGVAIPFLMLLGYIASTFFLNFFAYGASLVGIVMGLLGIALFVRRNRK